MVVVPVNKPASKKVYIETYGCQMNEYDSGLVQSILESAGYTRVHRFQEADWIMLNTCAIREKAHEKIYNRLRSMEGERGRNKAHIGILGCMAQNLGDELFAAGLPIDLLAGPDSYRQLPDLMAGINGQPQQTVSLLQLSRTETYSDIYPLQSEGPLAFTTIMRGCDNFCSFCVVPYTRGRERSRSPEPILHEIRKLIAEQDVQEVTLLGQNVNSYSFADFNFTTLCERILNETAIKRLRFTSPHPKDFPLELLELMAGSDRFCSQIHLPLQSGSSAVLARMRREYTRADFLQLVDRIRHTIPQVNLSTDVIVGFCGETEAEFQETMDCMREIRFDMAYMFHYSERKHTGAWKKMPDDVAGSVKLRRLQELIELQNSIALERNQSLVGRTFEVLAERPSKRDARQLMGRTAGGKSVVFAPICGPDQAVADGIGRFYTVQIAGATSATLHGHMAGITANQAE
ncbi:MAG: tRNA (N6-isopentenyl adenosine(37)-C2)-methylthiotransferase MiaB [Leptospiraceae bacterium]|nr:tRNA (N6-isopentenyl adenosine(37)-C2)-methylthiotransferase MiaB [Leptospiraceae bacterium]